MFKHGFMFKHRVKSCFRGICQTWDQFIEKHVSFAGAEIFICCSARFNVPNKTMFFARKKHVF